MRRFRTPALLIGAAASVVASCSPLEVLCTGVLKTTLRVEVRDRITGEPAARGVTGASHHEGGAVIELAGGRNLVLEGDWNREYPGRHAVTLRRPGYQSEYIDVFVEGGECHVETLTVEATIVEEPLATAVAPISFIDGPPIDAYPASAGVAIYGDTLEIKGFAPNDCSELHAVAYRVNASLHVQIEPSGVALSECLSPRSFEVRYLLPEQRTYLLVTNGYSHPVVLFNGQVRPS